MIAVVIAVLLAYATSKRYVRSNTLRTRVNDVELLTEAYLRQATTNSVPSFDDLLSDLKRNGSTLNNPIPKNPALPSYRIVANTGYTDFISFPSAVIIEETDNVGDAQVRVKGFADGSVRAERNISVK